MNTKINYLYRDASNYKVYHDEIVAGELSEEQKAMILDSLDWGEYFMPGAVGLPGGRFEVFDPMEDHEWFELGCEPFEKTDEEPTVEMTAAELAENFARCKDRWLEG